MTAHSPHSDPGRRLSPGKLSHRQCSLNPPLAAGPPAGGRVQPRTRLRRVRLGGSSRRRRGQVGVPMLSRVSGFSEPPSVFAALTLLPPPAPRSRRKGKRRRAVSFPWGTFQVRGDGPREPQEARTGWHWARRPCYLGQTIIRQTPQGSGALMPPSRGFRPRATSYDILWSLTNWSDITSAIGRAFSPLGLRWPLPRPPAQRPSA